MCGIAGIVSQSELDRGVLIDCADSMRHRGPDSKDKQEYCSIRLSNDYNVGLIHTRLAILDLTDKGLQPMYSASRNSAIVLNGEVYNYKELANEYLKDYICKTGTDTEVVLELLERYGLEALNWFRGMYAIGLLDVRNERLYLIRDKFGVKPLYYDLSEEGICFASELKGILALNKSKKYKLNLGALTSFFQYSYVQGEASILDGVKRLEAGKYLCVDLNKNFRSKLSTYWDAQNFLVNTENKVSSSEKELDQILTEAVNYRLVSDVPVGVFLSGGVDSSTVSSMLKESRLLKYFTIGFNQSHLDESIAAAKIAEHLGVEHIVENCSEQDLFNQIRRIPFHFDEPFADPSVIPTMQLCQMSSEYTRVVLSSDGGDELFGGYDKYEWTLALLKYSNKWYTLLFRMLNILATKFGPQIITIGSKKLLRIVKIIGILSDKNSVERILMNVQKYITDENIQYYLKKSSIVDYYDVVPSNFESLDRMSLLDIKTHLPNQIMTKVDRSSMAYSIEGREPLLDEDILRHAFRAKARDKINGKKRKIMLRKVAHHYLPKSLLNRPKQGFTPPLGQWLRGPMVHLLDEYLNESKLSSAIFNVSNILKAKKRLLEGSDSDIRIVWHTLIFQLWLEEWSNHIEY